MAPGDTAVLLRLGPEDMSISQASLCCMLLLFLHVKDASISIVLGLGVPHVISSWPVTSTLSPLLVQPCFIYSSQMLISVCSHLLMWPRNFLKVHCVSVFTLVPTL